MLPLIPLALSILSAVMPAAPAIAKMVLGDKGEEVANTIVSAAEAITGKSGNEVVDALKSDPGKLLQFQSEMMQHQATWAIAEMNAKRDIIVAETQSESWLTRNWRPLVMMDLMALVTAYWLGWTAPNITQDAVLALLEIVKYGLSGYIVGRSIEKTAPSLASMFTKK